MTWKCAWGVVWAAAGCGGLLPSEGAVDAQEAPPALVVTAPGGPSAPEDVSAGGNVGAGLVKSAEEIGFSLGPCGSVPGSGCVLAVPGREVRLGAQATDPTAPGYDPHAGPEEGPVRTVRVAPFWLMAAEVTVGERARCIQAGACEPISEGMSVGEPSPDLPSRSVTWADAEAFCRWAGGRLPSEAEWVAAATPEGDTRFPWGNEAVCAPQPANRDPARNRLTEALMARCGALVEAVRGRMTREQGLRVARVLHGGDPILADPVCEASSPDAALARLMDLVDREAARIRDPAVLPNCPPVMDLEPVTEDTPALNGFLSLVTNVAEWTADPWTETVGGDAVDGRRAVRGGHHLSATSADWRVSHRVGVPAGARVPVVGFRCAFDRPVGPEDPWKPALPPVLGMH